VLFVADLFVATFDRLVNQPTGFSAQRILALDTIAARPQLPVFWDQVAEHLRAISGVEMVALADWALMNGNSRNNFVSINGAPPTEVLAYFRYVSPGWIDVMRIPLIDGRDFRASDTSPGAAMVNETFAKAFLNGENPVGKSFERGRHLRYQIVGLVRDARYRNMREPILPVAFVPFHAIDAKWCTEAGKRRDVHSAHRRRSTCGTPSASGCWRRWRCSSLVSRYYSRVSVYMECSTTPCCSGGAKSALGWRSARKPAVSRDW
jgi:hypothetical protein